MILGDGKGRMNYVLIAKCIVDEQREVQITDCRLLPQAIPRFMDRVP